MSSGNASRCPVALQDQLEAQGERAHLILTGAGASDVLGRWDQDAMTLAEILLGAQPPPGSL